jgi:hypothetical protein
MRIALLVSGTLHPLAGDPFASQREHSWASGFRISPTSEVQLARFVRGGHARPIDRAGILNVVSFSTSRTFATAAEAELYACDLDDAARAGILIFQAVAPDGATSWRAMANAVVSPPSTRTQGATLYLDYTVQGGAITTATPTAATLATGAGDAGIVWTSTIEGPQGNSLSLITEDAVESPVTQVAYQPANKRIVVTRAGRARMEVTLTGQAAGVYVLEYLGAGITTQHEWVYDDGAGTVVVIGGSPGEYFLEINAPAFDEAWTSAGVWPDGETYTAVSATGTATVAALNSTASQVAAAAAGIASRATAALPGTGAETFAAVSPAASFTGGTI